MPVSLVGFNGQWMKFSSTEFTRSILDSILSSTCYDFQLSILNYYLQIVVLFNSYKD